MIEPLFNGPCGRGYVSIKDFICINVEVDFKTSCWNWVKCLLPNGYGRIFIKGETKGVHRVSYEEFNGPIPKGMFVCHHCDNPGCVKPSHLFIGTQSDNLKDAFGKGRLTPPCIRGEAHVSSKLVENDVHEIRRLYATGRVTQAVLGKMWRISEVMAGKIVNRRKWKHV